MKIKNLIAIFGLLILATSATFSEKNKITEDPVIKDISDESFVEFLSHFEKKELPFSIGLEDLDEYNNFRKDKITTVNVAEKFKRRSPIPNSVFIPGAQFGTMTRMGPPEITPVARFYPNEKMIAVVYSSKLRLGSGADKNYIMVVYDMKGNVLPSDSKDINEQILLIAVSSVEKTLTCRIDEKGRVWRNMYKNSWKNNLDEKWINENEITGFVIEDTEVYALDKTGKFEKLKEIPTVAKASMN